MLARIDRGRLRELARKELRQTLRDPRTVRVIFLAPVLQLVIFGYAVTTDIRDAAVVVRDLDHTSASRELTETLEASGYFRLVGSADRSQELSDALDHGRAILAVEIPRGFAADLAGGRTAQVQLLVDGTTSNTATVAQAYAAQVIQRFARERWRATAAVAGIASANGGAGAAANAGSVATTGAARAGAAMAVTAAPGVDLRLRAWYNPNLESRVYNVPAVVGNLMMLMSLLLTALAVVRERELGTLEQLMVSPLRPGEMILGKTLPVIGIALVQLTLVTAVAILWFHIPMRGSFALLLLASLVYITCGLGIGLLISTVSDTTQEAFMTMFMFFLPAMILSGLFFPVENMPLAFRIVSFADPVRYYIEAVRAIFLKGAGLGLLWSRIAALAAMSAAILWFATTRFRKTVA